jgi:hypothetical protein
METLQRAILQLREARALLGVSDSEGHARKELDSAIKVLCSAISQECQGIYAKAQYERPAEEIA